MNFVFTLDGTASIFIRNTIAAIPLAYALVAVRRWLPGAGYRKVVAYGAAFAVLPGLLLLTDSEFNINAVNATFGRALFALCYFSYGAVVGLVIETLGEGRARIPPTSRENKRTDARELFDPTAAPQ